MKPLRHLAVLWLAGSLALAGLTAVCFRLGATFATTALLFIIVIVVLSLMDSLISSVVFSVVAVACLNFFFTEPLFSLDVESPQDLISLAAFLITSIAVTGLVRRLRQLGEAQREQARLLDLTHDSIFICDLNDVITYWNDGAERLYGWTREEALGKLPYQLLRSVYPVPHERIKEILLSAGRWEGELIHAKRDGTQITMASRWTLHRDASGQPVRTLVANTDITRRKLAEDALRRAQETFLAEAQQLSHTGSFGWNVASGDIFWSEESFRIFGYDPQTKPTIELVFQRVHPEDVTLVQQVVDRAIRKHQDFDFEHRLLMPDSTVKHVHVVAHPVKDEPEHLRYMGAMMDITVRKTAEEALRVSEQRYRYLFHYMPIGLWQLDARGVTELFKGLRTEGVTNLGVYLDQHPDFLQRIMDSLLVEEVNEQAVKLFGARDRSELLGPTSRYWRNNPDTFRRAMETRFNDQATFQEETTFSTFDGREMNALFSAARLGTVGQLGISLVGIIDITEQVRAQARLNELQAEFAHAARIAVLGELTASIAHEINQPLAAMLTNGETALRWLNRPEPNLAKARDLMQRVAEDARRAADIIASIRQMATGRRPQQTKLSLHDLITDSIILLRHEMQSNGVAVAFDPAPALPQITADRAQLQQVVVNLAFNAAQAMAQAGSTQRKLLIQTRLSDAEAVCCTFEDSGPGISPGHLDHLFDRFFTTKDAGIGLGLPISRSIIEAHGGQIRADNKSVYGGARFCFLLPIADPALH